MNGRFAHLISPESIINELPIRVLGEKHVCIPCSGYER